MICPNCGATNREDARFCRSCGQSLAEVPVVEEKPAGGEKPAIDTIEIPMGEPEFGSEIAEPPVQQPLPGPQPEAPDQEAAEEPKVEVDEATEAVARENVEEENAGQELGPETSEPSPPAPVDQEAVEEEGGPLPELEGDVVGFWREEAEPLEALEPGTVIAGRYVLVETMDVQDDEIRYLARDLQRCWQCGYEGNSPDEAFCARCGASLERKPKVQLVQVRDDTAEPSSDEPVAVRLKDESHDFVVIAEPEPEPKREASPERGSFRLVVGQRSDVGQMRELDEDSLLALVLAPTYESKTAPLMSLFAVADGMGGHAGGEVASKMALQMLTEQVLGTIILPEFSEEPVPEDEILSRLRRATLAANDVVYLARQKAGNDMGTTLTSAYIRDDRLFLAHVGDCRAYRWNEKGLEQLTTDHSVIASMIDSGQAAPEEIYTHPHRSVIYRSIGDKPTVEVDTDSLPLAAGDRLIFCCDGLWEMIRNEGIADAMMQEADPQVACDLMVKRANAAGGEDNISVIVVQVEAT